MVFLSTEVMVRRKMNAKPVMRVSETARGAQLHVDVVARLRDMLVEGEIPPGARVPERELCEAFGISRTPLREALKVLAAEGQVVLLPNRGARAARLTARDVRELFDVCEGLEAIAGELACERITPEGMAELQALTEEMRGHFERRELAPYYRCNRAIHEGIVRAAGNTVLASFYEAVTARIRRARYVVPMPPDHWRLAMLEHDAIINALRRRDGVGLSHILRTHLRVKRQELMKAGFTEESVATAEPRVLVALPEPATPFRHRLTQ